MCIVFKLLELKPEEAIKNSLGCIKNPKHIGYIYKLPWYEDMYKKGLRILIGKDEKGNKAGFMEYVPGRYSWRAVVAPDYLLIHCIWTYPKKYQGKGLGKMMIDYSILEAKKMGLKGIATVAGKPAFVANTSMFEKYGFEIVDEKDDFRLMALTLEKDAELPKFTKVNMEGYKGLHMFYSYQCPMNPKYLIDIEKYCKNKDIDLNVHLITSEEEAQKCPNPLGIYALIYDNMLVSDHPVSLGRFKNIIHKELGF